MIASLVFRKIYNSIFCPAFDKYTLHFLILIPHSGGEILKLNSALNCLMCYYFYYNKFKNFTKFWNIYCPYNPLYIKVTLNFHSYSVIRRASDRLMGNVRFILILKKYTNVYLHFTHKNILKKKYFEPYKDALYAL